MGAVSDGSSPIFRSKLPLQELPPDRPAKVRARGEQVQESGPPELPLTSRLKAEQLAPPQDSASVMSLLQVVMVASQAHTSPAQFGKVMAMVEPRLAFGYHFYNDLDTLPEVLRLARTTYDGALAFAQDYMVFNVTKDDIQVRMSAIDEEIWPEPAQRPKLPPDTSKMIPFSDFTKSGALPMPEVVGPIFDEVNEKYGTDVEPTCSRSRTSAPPPTAR